DGPRAGEDRVEAVVVNRLTPARLAVVAALRAPGHGSAEQVLHDEASVEDHANRRKQAREEDLEQHAEAEPDDAAVQPRRRLGGDQDDAEELRQEEGTPGGGR